jgi:hypothetical protein
MSFKAEEFVLSFQSEPSHVEKLLEGMLDLLREGIGASQVILIPAEVVTEDIGI